MKKRPSSATWKDASALVVHTGNMLETRRSAYGTSVITPNEQVYIRSNLPPPGPDIVADCDAWEITIEGVR